MLWVTRFVLVLICGRLFFPSGLSVFLCVRRSVRPSVCLSAAGVGCDDDGRAAPAAWGGVVISIAQTYTTPPLPPTRLVHD